ncbi:hypothetical protein Fmac_023757 [Flemingia macrophylla]|uniref:Exostosin GT47 domain-containing protein n=1 Tax=Flemingia macrophylla TaxID=520843 RepID=A0ABD1LMG6_9FABA
MNEVKKSKEKAMAGMAKANKSTTSLSVSVSKLFLTFTILSALSLALYLLSALSTATIRPSYSQPTSAINVYVADIPPSLNYALLHRYWSSFSDSRLPSDHHHDHDHDHHRHPPLSPTAPPPTPLPRQPPHQAVQRRVLDHRRPHHPSPTPRHLLRQTRPRSSPSRRRFRPLLRHPQRRDAARRQQARLPQEARQRRLPPPEAAPRRPQSHRRLETLRRTRPRLRPNRVLKLKRCLADPVAMWHVKDEIAASVLLVVDFGGWYRLDSRGRGSNCSESGVVPHTQVSLLKDVIVPYTHLLPRLDLSENKERDKLLYFKGAKHRHRGGLIREKLWDLLINEPGVIMEEGFPNATGQEQSIKGMRTSEFCLHPAGDTPTSCRLFDAIQSLCIPVIVSDNIELPFEGMVDYSEFSLFVAVSDALKPSWLVNHLKSFSKEQKDRFRQNMARVQPVFVYDNGQPGGIGPIPLDGAVNHIWKKVHQKLPMIKEAIIRERRKPPGVSVPRRCHCA